MMIMLAQVIAEYGALASDRGTGSGSVDRVGSMIDRITDATSGEQVAMVLGALVVLYVVKRVLDAF